VHRRCRKEMKTVERMGTLVSYNSSPLQDRLKPFNDDRSCRIPKSGQIAIATSNVQCDQTSRTRQHRRPYTPSQKPPFSARTTRRTLTRYKNQLIVNPRKIRKTDGHALSRTNHPKHIQTLKNELGSGEADFSFQALLLLRQFRFPAQVMRGCFNNLSPLFHSLSSRYVEICSCWIISLGFTFRRLAPCFCRCCSYRTFYSGSFPYPL